MEQFEPVFVTLWIKSAEINFSLPSTRAFIERFHDQCGQKLPNFYSAHFPTPERFKTLYRATASLSKMVGKTPQSDRTPRILESILFPQVFAS